MDNTREWPAIAYIFGNYLFIVTVPHFHYKPNPEIFSSY